MKQKASHGFTLLEVVLVIAIIASVIVFAFPKFGGQQTEIRNTVRRLGVISREAKRSAKLYNATFRLVLLLAPADANSETDYVPQFWLEKAPGSVLLATDKARESKKGDATAEELFSMDKRILKAPFKLPAGLTISKVEIASQKSPITNGKAYIYYLPEGLVTEAAIHLTYGDDMKWTVAIQPLTGKADIFDKEVALKELAQ